MNLEEAVTSLKALGIQHAVQETGTEGAVLFLPEYGRVFGLWTHWRGDNAFWTNPEFMRSLQIGAKQTEWINPGGDRMWLGPETEFFVADPKHASESYRVPQALDPGSYTVSAQKGLYCMENRGEVWAFRAQMRIGFRMQRQIKTLGAEEFGSRWGLSYLRQAGYTEQIALDVHDAPSGVALWNVVSFPLGGEGRIPMQKYWARSGLTGVPAGTVHYRDECAVVDCRAGKTKPLWLDAVECRDRVAYIRPHEAEGRSTLVLKEFEKAAPGEYLAESEQRGILGGVVGVGCAAHHCEVSCRSQGTKKRLAWKTTTWAFSGRTEEVLAALVRSPAGVVY